MHFIVSKTRCLSSSYYSIEIATSQNTSFKVNTPEPNLNTIPIGNSLLGFANASLILLSFLFLLLSYTIVCVLCVFTFVRILTWTTLEKNQILFCSGICFSGRLHNNKKCIVYKTMKHETHRPSIAIQFETNHVLLNGCCV